MADRVIEVFAEVTCPFAHVSLQRFVQQRALRGADQVGLRVRAWPLELVDGHPQDRHHIAEEIVDIQDQVAGDLFAGFDEDAFPATTLPALGLATAAYARGHAVGEAVSLAVREALFEQGRRVDEDRVLDALAAEHGVDRPDPERSEALVRADWALGQERGVTGSPHYFLGDGSFFCPALDIERRGDHLHVEVDDGPFRAFLDRAFA